MEKYFTFLDEHGSADPKTYKADKYFVVTAVLSNPSVKDSISDNLENLKAKHFGKKSYVIHRTDLYKDIQKKSNMKDFLTDLKSTLNDTFVIFQVIVNKENAYKKGWVTKSVYRKVYRALLANITKFSVAKSVRNIICVEASSSGQDIIIYQNFFHFIANGIPTLKINPADVKQYLTSLDFVTKINNDAGEQLADLFSKSGKQKLQIEEGELSEKELKDLDLLLLNILEQKLFKQPKNCTNKTKLKIYPSINSFEVVI
jgi:hypothetical protein